MIRNREISSAELTAHYIERIEKLDGPNLNAVPVRIFERAREDADRKPTRQWRAERNSVHLHGVPMTIKESYVMRDTPTTWGLEAFRNNIGRADGIAVNRFRAAGAHFLGKTNVPTNLGDFQTYNPLYGTTGNPWDTDRTPGGSSGGSAAALAAGLSALDAGSDIGGSIRNPRALLRRIRSQADVGHRAHGRPRVAGTYARRGSERLRPAGAQRRRPRYRSRYNGGRAWSRTARLAPGATATGFQSLARPSRGAVAGR